MAYILYEESEKRLRLELRSILKEFSGLQQPPACTESKGACNQHMEEIKKFKVRVEKFIKDLREQVL